MWKASQERPVLTIVLSDRMNLKTAHLEFAKIQRLVDVGVTAGNENLPYSGAKSSVTFISLAPGLI